uniref:Transposase n=1 Tax=Strongyloides papillosus TaxID=174720 RepID=A0A0N5C8U2_STREA
MTVKRIRNNNKYRKERDGISEIKKYLKKIILLKQNIISITIFGCILLYNCLKMKRKCVSRYRFFFFNS